MSQQDGLAHKYCKSFLFVFCNIVSINDITTHCTIGGLLKHSIHKDVSSIMETNDTVVFSNDSRHCGSNNEIITQTQFPLKLMGYLLD